jgi:tRNA(fMet)-specific endonuclease VapC
MSLWILDTDHISLWQTDHPIIRQKLGQIDPTDFAVTIVSFEEQMRGRLNEIQRAGSDAALVAGYRHLQMTEQFFGSLNVLAYSSEAQSLFQQLRKQRVRIGTRDLRIASIGLSVNGTIVTRNQRDFRQVPGLRLADWTIIGRE